MLTKLDELVPILTSLGTKHVGYGVVPEHYAIVGEALIATLGDALGDAFDAETVTVIEESVIETETGTGTASVCAIEIGIERRSALHATV